MAQSGRAVCCGCRGTRWWWLGVYLLSLDRASMASLWPEGCAWPGPAPDAAQHNFIALLDT